MGHDREKEAERLMAERQLVREEAFARSRVNVLLRANLAPKRRKKPARRFTRSRPA